MSNRYGLEIRAAAEADAPALAELLQAAGLAIPPLALAERLGALRTAGGTALVAQEWGPPSGLVVMSWLRTLESELPVAQITSLFVGPNDRRRGIARLLLKAASQAARVAGCGTLWIFAAPGQDGLTAFCKATGFAAADAGFVRPLRKKSQEI
ncbi:GNAT family N-acetyltransferase [Methylobacterium haplocladii]|uniref:GNAT family N-acetyltransferase n=1 Tax=Methylobacterium haplocladii TaxID=1176176 RepID=UPI001EDEA174|nr:GNAT family N-acetyltransferase [Methylobacterium haplocladii]GLS61162.1 hypothetical protein GCM10007887_38580 [Methylobacterium haplocladii]